MVPRSDDLILGHLFQTTFHCVSDRNGKPKKAHGDMAAGCVERH